MASRTLKACVLSGLVMAAASGAFYYSQAPDDSNPSLVAPQVQLRTHGLPKAVILPGDPRQRKITAFDIQGYIPKDGDGTGTITLDQSTLSFNDFGDAKIAKPDASEPIKVTFKRLPVSERDTKRRLYEIVFVDGALSKRMYLALSDGAIGPHRLILHNAERLTGSGATGPTDILDLQGLPKITNPFSDVPQSTTIYLTTLSPAHGPKDSGLQQVAIHATSNGTASVDLDPNYLGFSSTGEIVSSTLIGKEPIPAKLRRVDIPDPAEQGRRLFEIVAERGNLSARYYLVLSKSEAGEHRLLIRNGDDLQYVLPLHNPERRYHLEMQALLSGVPREETQAITDLRRRIGYGFRFKVESKKVIELSVSADVDSDSIDPTLEHLTDLQTLEFNGVKLTATGLPSLRHLRKLDQLRFTSATINDRGLESVKDLQQLRGLTFYCCRGVTDEGLAHFAGLRNLKWLRLYREDSLNNRDPKEKVITDTGLENFKRLAELEYLDLIGQKITDAGLARLKDLNKLKDLYLSGDGITDAGLQHLQGLMNLNTLYLLQTRVTPEGKQALKAKLPKLQRDR